MSTGPNSFQTSDGTSISYDDKGSGRPIIFVHGWAATGEFWRSQLEALSHRFRTIALDLRGHGDSDKKIGADYSIGRMGRDLGELIEALALQDYVLVGHSMGAVVAARVAEEGGGCTGFVLTGVPLKIPGGFSLLTLDILMRMRWLAEKVVTPRMFAPHASEELLDFVRKESAKSPADVLVSVMKQAAGTNLLPEEGLRTPSIVIAGEFDRMISPAKQKIVADRLGAKYVVVKEVGHNLMLENPSEFSKLVEDFASVTTPTA